MTKSKTEKDNGSIDSIIGVDSYKTTISDENGNQTTGRGNTSEESQKVASEKYERGQK